MTTKIIFILFTVYLMVVHFLNHYHERTKRTQGEWVQGRCTLFAKFQYDDIISANLLFCWFFIRTLFFGGGGGGQKEYVLYARENDEIP